MRSVYIRIFALLSFHLKIREQHKRIQETCSRKLFELPQRLPLQSRALQQAACSRHRRRTQIAATHHPPPSPPCLQPRQHSTRQVLYPPTPLLWPSPSAQVVLTLLNMSPAPSLPAVDAELMQLAPNASSSSKMRFLERLWRWMRGCPRI